ncbi:uncharacterized protein [Drosophila kikkawai]|uniref:Uncharacterized protein n=1 Tax=Drosophila kikkawai TaxID=30033 RepID=A0A6P4J4W6_DROKI|nr:uncharacterized protein LOC108080248 [Drosophila kikkawai]
MFKAPAANESKSRPLAAIGSERAARLAAIGNQDLGKVMAPPDNLNPCPNSRGARLPAIGSERAARLLALRNLNTSQGLAVWQLQSSRLSLPLEHSDVDISFSVIPDWQADPPTGGHSRSGYAFLARFMENLDPDQAIAHRDNLNRGLPQVRGGRTPSPPRALEAIGSERAAHLAALRNLNMSPSSSLQDNDGDTPFCDTHWSDTSMLPGWQTDSPTGGHSRNESATHQQKLESIFQPERVPHPERNPLPPPSLPLTTRPEGLHLLLDNSPVQAESSWLSMLPKLQAKAKSTPLPELPLSLNDERVLDDLHRVQAINRRLVERIFGQMPDEQSRQRFQGELLSQQLAAEQQLAGFLERKLGQDPGCLDLEMEGMQ